MGHEKGYTTKVYSETKADMRESWTHRCSQTNCQSSTGRVQMCPCVMAGGTEMCEEDGWRRNDDKKDSYHSLSSSPGNFSVTSCHHLVTLCPRHPVTSPLSNRACQSIVMWPGSPLTFCFFNTRYREKSWSTGGRAVVSGHAYLPRSQATINATWPVDLWQSVILCVQTPFPLAITNRTNRLDKHTQMLSLQKFQFLHVFVWVIQDMCCLWVWGTELCILWAKQNIFYLLMEEWKEKKAPFWV